MQRKEAFIPEPHNEDKLHGEWLLVRHCTAPNIIRMAAINLYHMCVAGIDMAVAEREERIMTNGKVWLFFSTLVCSAALVCVDVVAQEKPPNDLPDLTESSKLQDKVPKVVSGTVTLSGKAVEGARVTDGVDFVTTDKDGRYTITLKPDPLMPYLPSRTIAVSWPSGTWPVRDDKTGRYRYWARLKDVLDPKNVNFELVSREVAFPMCVGFGTDAHDSLSRPHNMIYNTDIANAPGHVAFAVMGGDLSYVGFGNSEDVFKAVEEYTKKFPVPLLHCIGNHDVAGIHTKWFGAMHEVAGYGGVTKRLNPARWSFDCAGIRFIGMDYGMIDTNGAMQCGISDTAIEWLARDLASKPDDMPAYFFNHQPWSPNPRFYELCAKHGVRLCLGGDTHRNMFLNDGGGVPKPGETQYWSKMSLYTLVYIDKAGFDFVDVCVYEGGRNGWDGWWGHNGRGCALYCDQPDTNTTPRGEHFEARDVKLDSRSQEIKVVKGETYDLRFGAKGSGGKPAKRWGLRMTGKDGKVQEFVYDDKEHFLTLMGRKTPFNPAMPAGNGGGPANLDPKEQEWVEMRIFVLPDQIRVLVNSRLHYQKPVKPGELKKIEFFSEGGEAEFGRVDVWQRTYKDYKPRVQFNAG